MSQPLISNGSINAIDPKNTKDINDINELQKEVPIQIQQPQANQPNVRHIPIFVEGRDEPLFNRNLDTTTVDAPIIRSPSVTNDIPQHGSIFSRARDIPVKKVIPDFHAGSVGRSSSPARTIPINVVHAQSNKTTSSTPPKQPTPQKSPSQHSQPKQVHSENIDRRSQSPKPFPVDPITKIHNIQKEILDLMDKVEQYEGGSRRDKDYIYLDEMLTQNLLKLDLIDTEGKDNIKAARKEVINCINKCIQVLEAKSESKNMSNNNISQESASQRGEGNTDKENPDSSGAREGKQSDVQGSST